MRADRIIRTRAAAVAAAALLTAPLQAHHSFAMYDMQVVRTFTGVVTRVDPAATAFPHRNTRYAVLSLAAWVDPADEAANIAWTDSVLAVIARERFGTYVNASIGNPLNEVFGANYARLVSIKATYDPDNMFHGNVNIQPAK